MRERSFAHHDSDAAALIVARPPRPPPLRGFEFPTRHSSCSFSFIVFIVISNYSPNVEIVIQFVVLNMNFQLDTLLVRLVLLGVDPPYGAA